jgi:Alkaline and neutral invertase
MQATEKKEVEAAKKAAVNVLLHNAKGPFDGLPRTAGWGYPEPYTRDLMFSIFGVAVAENEELIGSIRKVLETLAANQTPHGHIPSLVHNKNDLGASDTTPLFLLGTGIFRKLTGEHDFLEVAVNRSLTWMEYQSPTDGYLVTQQPTSDWRDEQWVLGYGLFVNTVVYSYLRTLGKNERAEKFALAMNQPTGKHGFIFDDLPGSPISSAKPYFAFWNYKVFTGNGFDLLGNSLAILSGLATYDRANDIIDWVENECNLMMINGDLSVNMAPNFFPFTRPGDEDWHKRYEGFNLPGNYHNGGIWPFIGGLYVAALVAAKRYNLAEKKLLVLTKLIKLSRDPNLDFGFNEWIKAQTGEVMGVDWQTWSAALFLYAATCVEQKRTPYFDEIRVW